MTKLYLDIDGVLLTKKNTRAAEYSGAFLKFVVDNFDCYWLTTHCKGDATTAIKYLSNYFGEEVLRELSKIKATSWDALKTEGVDLKGDFYWLDDCPLNAELAILANHDIADRLIVVNLENEEELKRIESKLLRKAC